MTHEDMASLLDAADERALRRFMSMVDQQTRGTERRYTWDFAHGQFNMGNDTLDLPSWARYFTIVVGSNASAAATLDSLTIEVNGLPETIAAGTTGSIGYSLLAGGGTLKITSSATSPEGQLYVRVADRVIGQVHGGSMTSVSLTGSLGATTQVLNAVSIPASSTIYATAFADLTQNATKFSLLLNQSATNATGTLEAAWSEDGATQLGYSNLPTTATTGFSGPNVAAAAPVVARYMKLGVTNNTASAITTSAWITPQA